MSPASFVQRPMLWMRAIAKYAGNVAMGPDFGYRLVLRAVRPEDVAKLELAPLRSVCNGAEPVRADTLAEFSRVFAPAGFLPEHHYPSYGLAEASALVSGWHPGEPPTLLHVDAAELERDGLREVEPGHPNARTLVGCGRPAEDVGVVVVDPSTRARCAPDRVGEIWVSGPNVARGYWRRPDVTAAAFGARTIDGAGPFYRTGDLGFLKDGHVFIAGRLKDLVIIDGRNHYPQDIEQTLEGAYPDLRSGGGAVFSVDDGRAERLVVVSEIARGTDGAFDVEAAARAVRGAVSRMHDVAPSEVVFLTAGGLPKTSSGKVQRRACRLALRAGELPIVGRVRYEEE
jgi:acyl-CoA synthetase (AMP-forming)/AMP-acid ligase II